MYQNYDEIFPGDVVGPLLLLFAYFLNTVVVIMERFLDIHSSVLLFYFWLVHFLSSIPALIKDVENFTNADTNSTSTMEFEFLLGLIKLFFILLSLIAHCISDQYFENNDQSPESKSSHFSNLVWSWMDGIIYKGYKQPLTQSDIPRNPDYLVYPG